MATTSQAQEELRRIRAAQAEEADRQKVIDDAEKAEQERKAAFAARKAAFGGSQKPTDEEVKEEIQKAAAKRKFTRQLTRQLTSGSAGGTSFSRDAGDGDSDWQFVDQGKLAPSYYWNRVTNEITYENPFEAKSETSDDVSKGWTKVPVSGDQPEYYWNSVSGESAFELPAGASVQEADESSQWTSGVDEGSGLTYYYNYVTGTTQWAVPACLKPPADGSADDAANWTSGVDEASGYTYYCNIVTCETQWERPACLDSTSPAEILPSVEDPAVAEERNPAVAEDATVPEKAGPPSDVAPSPAPPAPASNPTSPTIDRPPPPPPPPKPPAQEGSAGSLQPPPPPPPRRQASEEQTQAKPQRRMTGFALPGMGTMTIHQAMKRATTPPGPIVAKSEEQACTIDPVGAETDTPSKPLPEISMKPDNSDAQGDDTEAPGDKANVAGDGSDAPGDDSELPGGKADVAVTTAVNGRESMVRIAEDNQEEAESSDDECNDFVEAPERMTEMSSAERPTADFTDRPTSLAITEIRTLDNLREDMTTEELKVAVGDITFDYYADNFFIYERKGLFKSKSTASKMLQWKNELIKMPLRKLSSPDLHKAALQLFRNVTGFMGDRKSSKPKEDHAEKILSYAIRFNQELHDEIFLQICKQLTKNPSPASVKQGWELTTLCLSVFPPSPELLYPLLSFFSSNLTSSDSDVAKYAAFCMHSCLKRARLGVKSVDEVPTMAEMSTIWTL